MGISYATTTKNNRLTAVVTDLGSTSVLVIGTSALAGATGVLATIPLASTPFTISGGVATLAGTPRTATASGTGTAAKAELRTGGGTVIASDMTVGTSGTDIIINATNISSGQTVQCTAGSITHAA